MGNNADERWLSRRELADRYGLPIKTLAQWASKGSGPRYARMGRHVRYRLSDIIEWEEKRLDDDLRAAAQPGDLTKHAVDQAADTPSDEAHFGSARDLR